MRKVKIAVLGGGITGRLIKYQLPEAEVFDWTRPAPGRPKSLTRSFGANYLWHPIGDIPCRGFQVITRINYQIPTRDLIAAYKMKIGRIPDPVQDQRQFLPEMNGYEFEEPLTCDVTYDHRAVEVDRINHQITFANQESVQYELLLSTIPLYSLLSLCGIPEPKGKLQFKPIFFKVMACPPDAPYGQRRTDLMFVNYLTDPGIVPYRFTDREGERHYESIVPYDGVVSTKRFAPGKIYAHPDVPDLLEYLDGFGISGFGRFGAWAPDELVHETWHHIAAYKEGMGL